MSSSFDYTQFNHRSAGIIVHSVESNFEDCVFQIKRLKEDYLQQGDEVAQGYVERSIDELTLRIMIDKCQPFADVFDIYWSNVNRGFNSLWSEVFLTIEFAEYCCEEGHLSEGIRVLQNTRDRVSNDNDNLSKGLKRHLLREIDMSVKRLHKLNAQRKDKPSE